MPDARVTQAGAYLEADVGLVTQAGAYLEAAGDVGLVTQAGAYLEIAERRALVTQVGVYVEVELPLGFVTQLGAYVEVLGSPVVGPTLAQRLRHGMALVDGVLWPAGSALSPG